MRKFLAIAIVLLVAAIGVSAEEGTVFERYPSAIGINGSAPIETFGLSYQRWFGKVGAQVTAGGAFTSSNEYSYSVQAGALFRIFDYDFSNWFSGGLYLVGLAGHIGEPQDVQGNGVYVFSPGFHGALGIGIETVLFEHFSNDIQLFYYGATHASPLVSIGIGGSFRYRF